MRASLLFPIPNPPGAAIPCVLLPDVDHDEREAAHRDRRDAGVPPRPELGTRGRAGDLSKHEAEEQVDREHNHFYRAFRHRTCPPIARSQLRAAASPLLPVRRPPLLRSVHVSLFVEKQRQRKRQRQQQQLLLYFFVSEVQFKITSQREKNRIVLTTWIIRRSKRRQDG